MKTTKYIGTAVTVSTQVSMLVEPSAYAYPTFKAYLSAMSLWLEAKKAAAAAK